MGKTLRQKGRRTRKTDRGEYKRGNMLRMRCQLRTDFWDAIKTIGKERDGRARVTTLNRSIEGGEGGDGYQKRSHRSSEGPASTRVEHFVWSRTIGAGLKVPESLNSPSSRKDIERIRYKRGT